MSPDHLSATFAALADPTRRAILARLGSGETSVTELAAPFAMTTPAITKHLKVLERAGLITRSRQAQWRPCRLNAAPLHEVVDYLEHYRQFWEQSFDRLEAYLKTIQTPIAPKKPSSSKKPSPPIKPNSTKHPQSSKQKEKKNGQKKC